MIIETAVQFDVDNQLEVIETFEIPNENASQFIEGVLALLPYNEVQQTLNELGATKVELRNT